MQKIKTSELDFPKIIQTHKDYCIEQLNILRAHDNNLPELSKDEIDQLFIKEPYDKSSKLKDIYTNNPKFEKYDFIDIYTKFRKYCKTKWCGWKLIQSLGINVCPYCGQQYLAIATNKNNTIAEATLDHYFSKERYKYLALNFFNLIPVCKNCNSSYKGNSDERIVNPYSFSYGKYIRFEIKNLDIINYLDKSKNFKLHITNLAKEPEIRLLVDKHTEILCIKERYEFFQTLIKSLILKKQAYETSGITQLVIFLKKMQIKCDDKDIEDIILCSDIIAENEPMKKFKKDIWNQLSNSN